MDARLVLLVAVVALFGHVAGHGRLEEPPSRASAWRFGFKTPVNTQDNELFCGGFSVSTRIFYIYIIYTFFFIMNQGKVGNLCMERVRITEIEISNFALVNAETYCAMHWLSMVFDSPKNVNFIEWEYS